MHTKFQLENLKETELRRTSHRWEDNINMGYIETGCEHVKWIKLAQNISSDGIL
jgi:hypothetical protein